MVINSYIARSLPASKSLHEGVSVYVLPSSNNWNDFGYRLMVEISFVNQQQQILSISREAKLYIEGHFNTSEFLQTLSSEALQIEDGQIGGQRFVSSLGNRQQYEKLLSFIGQEYFVETLLSINDVSALRFNNSTSPSAALMESDDAIHLGILRTSEAYFAFIGLQRLIKGAQPSGAKSQRRTQIAFLESVTKEGSLFTLGFDDTKLGRNLINAFIGPNGVGKTRLLRNLAETALAIEPQGIDPDARPMVSAILSENCLPLMIFSHETPRWDDLATHGATICALNISGESWTKLTSELFDFVRSSGADDSAYSWAALCRVAKDHIPIRNLHFPRIGGGDYAWSEVSQGFFQSQLDLGRELDRKRPVVFRDEENQTIELSSGQKVILTFLTRLFQNVKPNSLIIVDEPETHLHPQFISLLMLTLYDALSANDAIAVIATHSPYVVRELDKSAVTVVKSSADEGTYFARPTLQTRGANLSALSNYVFEHTKESPSLVTQLAYEFIMSLPQEERESAVELLGDAIGSDAQYYVLDVLRAPTND